MKTIYQVKRFNLIKGQYDYYNSFESYREAAEARDDLQRRYGGRFEVFQTEIEEN